MPSCSQTRTIRVGTTWDVDGESNDGDRESNDDDGDGDYDGDSNVDEGDGDCYSDYDDYHVDEDVDGTLGGMYKPPRALDVVEVW